jgi:transposase
LVAVDGVNHLLRVAPACRGPLLEQHRGSGKRRVTHALIFTACYSRHCFVYLTQRQTMEQVIAGFEAAWAFFGGVFRVVIPDNLKRSRTGRTRSTRG